MTKRLPIIFLYLFIAFNVTSQVQKFSNDANTFVEQVEERFAAASDKKIAKIFSEKLLQFWNDPETTSEIKKLIIKTCNLMAVKRARPYPDYDTYLTTVVLFYDSDQRIRNFDTWHKVVVDMLKKKHTPLRTTIQFLKQTKGLISNSEIYSSPSVKWICKTDDITYRYANNELSLKFGTTDILCRSKNDSIKIYDTRGIFYPFKQTWEGDKGKVTWERSGFRADEVYATFGKYRLNMKKNYFVIDSVDFYNRFYFDYPLKGRLKHKVMTIHNPANSIYPKFQSFEQRYKIDHIHPNINYEGGFSQNGAKFLGSGTTKNPATITIYRNDTLFITAKSLFFALRKDHILGNETEITIKLDSGFIYHPGLTFKYMAEDNEVFLIRNGEGMAQSPYFDTYHNISMDVELISWKMNETWMDLKMITGAAENKAFFESLNYFREEFYNQLQGMDAIHPLQGLKNCSGYFGGGPFTAKDYANYMGLPENQIRQQIMNLSFYGFIGYNVNTDIIEIRQHLYDYLLFRLGKKDYDVIRFNSETPGKTPNAQLDLKNFDLNLNGVKNISISDHQNVVFFPQNEKIQLKKNRNLQFDGRISAGMLKLYGNGFLFSYETFSIDMKNIDSLKMRVQTSETDYFGKPVLHDIENSIANLSGILQIDDPNNKSGIKNFAQYPIITSTKQSYVYYNKKDIQDGVYDPEKFYFTLEPFEMDSLNSLSKKNFDFAGTFTSSIFPKFKENLKIQKDFTLGFKCATPPEGYDVYGGKAHFTDFIELSKKGLTGNGTLKYLTSTSVSEEFTFLPDHVKGIAHEFTVDKKSEDIVYPDVTSKYVVIDYYPKKEELYAQSQEEYFKLFNQEAQLNGKLRLTPFGANGKGRIFMLRGSLSAPRLTFSDHSVLADSSSFKLVGEDEEAIKFSTTNLISSNVDFETREGVFTSMGEGDPVTFDENKYMAIITKFSWDMDLNKIYMGARGSKGNLFISINKKQDSLQFYVPIAEYDMDNTLIVAEEVKYINVADTKMVLKNGFVYLRENAAMDPLDSVVIEIGDTTTYTHRIYDAKVNITGRYAYNATGYYDYVNEDNKTCPIFFHSIEATRKVPTTTALGLLTETNMFTFNSHFAYKGKVYFNAKEQFLTFDGGVQLLHRCSRKGPKAYMRFKAAIDPLKVMIPVAEETEDFERDKIYKDFFITKDSAHIYSSFLERRETYSDIPIITGTGYLTYNEKEHSFDIASKAKMENPDTTGTLLRYDEDRCTVYGTGKLNLGIPLGQIKTLASGTITDNRNKEQISLSGMFGVDFFMDNKTIDILYSSFINSGANISNLPSPKFIKRLSEWTGKATAKVINQKRSIMGAMDDLPENMKNTFTFSNIEFKWNSKKHCYYADGKADLAFIKQFVINQQVKVKMEITRKRSGNSIEMLIEADKEMWFFFSYKNGIMYTLSSNGEYNTYVRELDPSKRKIKSLGGSSYIYMFSPESKKERFLKEFGERKARVNNPLDRDNL